ncbi:MAG TPA: hypothetical protein VF587_05380 [Solirubrobacteraceae bacterium]
MRSAAAALALATLVAAVGAVESRFTTTVSGASRFGAAPVFPPRPLTAPVVSGTVADGETLTATTGTWARAPKAFRIEWLRCAAEGCVAVGEGPTRELTADDAGRRIRVRVTATNDGGSTAASSAETGVVAPLAPPQAATAPKIGGAATVGQTLTAGDGTFTGRRLTVTRRWLRCATTCAPIAGETDQRLLVTGDDAGATLKLEVTATNAAGTATATTPATSTVARLTYTQILCADPATGQGVATDGALPSGLRVGGTIPDRFDPRPQTRCAPGSQPVVPLSTGATFSTTTPDERIVLEYRLVPGTEFRGATLYRQAQMSGKWSWAIQSASVTNLFATPVAELCSWGDGCTTRGTTADRFAPQNRVEIPPSPNDGFNVTLACDIGSGGRCDADGSQTIRVFGGRVTLRDTATPKVTAKGGGLLDGPLQPLDDLDLTATDTGAGLWRLHVTIDGEEVAARPIHDNQGRCRADGEFAMRQPCVLSAATSLAFDTTTWPKQGRLRVLLEDAGRNTTVVANRELP